MKTLGKVITIATGLIFFGSSIVYGVERSLPGKRVTIKDAGEEYNCKLDVIGKFDGERQVAAETTLVLETKPEYNGFNLTKGITKIILNKKTSSGGNNQYKGKVESWNTDGTCTITKLESVEQELRKWLGKIDSTDNYKATIKDSLDQAKKAAKK